MEMITFLKRRFSSGDLQGEAADKREQEGMSGNMRFVNSTSTTAQASSQGQQYGSQSTVTQTQPYQRPMDTQMGGGGGGGVPGQDRGPYMNQNAVRPQQGFNTDESSSSATYRGKATYPSAPTSPTRSFSGGSTSFMGPMGSIRGHISSTIMRGFSNAASTAQNITTGKSTGLRERQKVLLVIDDSQTDWCKYFKGRKIMGDWDIRVEQAQFSEISMTAYSDHGCIVNIHHGIQKTKPSRSFKPDFVLLRQHSGGANEDWQSVLTGFMYAGTPCMNTLHAVVNMKNRPWLFAHLLMLRNRLGKDAFPLITQTYYTSHKEMITAPVFPTIVKVGLGHGGEGKIRADNPMAYQDVVSLLVSNNAYATTEPFVDAKCDVHVQKIGPQYKAFVRKSISGHWKSNAGSAILEKVPMNDKFKQWVDEVSRMFGGLDICSVEALQSKTDDYFIYDINGSDMALFGESQEDDRREIAELVVQRMQSVCSASTITKTPSLQSMSRANETERGRTSGFTTPTAAQSYAPSACQAPSQPLPPPPPPPQPPQAPVPPQSISPMPPPPPSQTRAPMMQQTAQHPSYTGPPPSGPQHPASRAMSPPGSTMFNQPLVPTQMQQPFQQQSFPSQQHPQPPQPPSQQHPPIEPTQFRQPSTGSSPSPAGVMNAWGEQGSMSSISSSAGSVSSAYTGITSAKVDSSHPSGQRTPVMTGDQSFGSGGSVPSGQTAQQSAFDAAFQSTRQSPFSNSGFDANSSATQQWAQGGGGSQATGNFSSSGKVMDRSNNARDMFDSNDTFGRMAGGQGSGSNSMSGGTSFDPNPQGNTRQTNATIFPRQESAGPDRPFVPPRQTSLRTGEDPDDTMKNLRKTFAGIFGDM